MPPQRSRPLPYLPPAHPGALRPGEWVILGVDINPDFAYVAALGRHARAPSDSSLQGAAEGIAEAEHLVPGALNYLADLLFPGGLREGGDMLEPLYVVLGFCHGWFLLSSQGLVPR